jgi:ZIP family zinc transporter
MAIHNIPEGMAVAAAFKFDSSKTPRKNSSSEHWNIMRWTILSGLCEPIGALVFAFLFGSYIHTFPIQAMMPIVAGIMVHISLVELIPSSLQHLSAEVSELLSSHQYISSF